MRLLATFFLAVVLIGEAVLIRVEWRQLADLQKLVARADDLRGRFHDEQRRLATLRQTVAKEQTRAEEKATAQAKREQAASAAAQGNQNGQHRGAEALIEALNNKAFRDALETVDRDYNLRTAAPFLRSLGLSADQVNHMLDLMGQMMIAKMDANQSANDNDLDLASRNALIAQTQQDIVSQIQSYLDAQQFEAFEQWNREQGVRAIASNLQTALSYTSTPLSDAQAQQLANAMYQAIPDWGKPDASGLGAMQPLTGNPMPPITELKLTAAQSVLSPPQLSTLQEMAEQQKALGVIRQSGGL